MSPARKDDESVETSLRELMEQEEARIRAEAERLAQLRLAKARIDRERAEAAREAEEARRKRERDDEAERDAKKAAAIEAARVESLARAEAAPRVVVVTEPAPPAKPRFGAGVATGAVTATCLAILAWLAWGAPRIAHAASTTEAVRAELEQEKSHAREAASAGEAALEDSKREVEALRGESDRLRHAPAPCPTIQVIVPPHRRATTNVPACDPHDPLCGQL